MCSLCVALIHTKGPRHRRKICSDSLRQYSFFIQTSPSKNKNINYMFIYLRGIRCLSSGALWDNARVSRISPECHLEAKSYKSTVWEGDSEIAFLKIQIWKFLIQFSFWYDWTFTGVMSCHCRININSKFVADRLVWIRVKSTTHSRRQNWLLEIKLLED